MATLDDLKAKLKQAASKMPQMTKDIIEVEGLNFIKKNFREEGFTDSSLKKWKDRKTVDGSGRDITRYRTNRRGKKGSLNAYGRKNQGRPILTGHNTAGDKLRNSFRAKQRKYAVVFYTYKKYAKVHNEGEGHMPKRMFMGKSQYLDGKIKDKVKKSLDKLLK